MHHWAADGRRAPVEVVPAQLQTVDVQPVRAPVGLHVQATQLFAFVERQPTDLDTLDLQRQRQLQLRQAERLGVRVRLGWGETEFDIPGHQLLDAQSAFEQARR